MQSIFRKQTSVNILYLFRACMNVTIKKRCWPYIRYHSWVPWTESIRTSFLQTTDNIMHTFLRHVWRCL